MIKITIQEERAIGQALCHLCGVNLEGKEGGVCIDTGDVIVCPKCMAVVKAIIGEPWKTPKPTFPWRQLSPKEVSEIVDKVNELPELKQSKSVEQEIREDMARSMLQKEEEPWDVTNMETDQWKEYVMKPVRKRAVEMTHPFSVVTNMGTMEGRVYDYLVEGISGERYPVRRDIFEKTYREV